MNTAPPRTGFVVIGRNEGERLKRCLRSVPQGHPAIYVDSGSTDGSVEFAKGIGVSVEILATHAGFTAARARNAGWRRLIAEHPGLEYVQFIDGDCELASGWLDQAERTLDGEPRLCATFGRRRERFPQASFYNALCDDEWNVPVGLVKACGGDVLFHVEALRQVNGYDDTLIAGEEPDLCLRLAEHGWQVRRIDAEMTLHDADIHRARQQWLRARRAGHAFAEHVSRHGRAAFPSWRRQRRSIVIWGAVIPAVILVASGWALVTKLPFAWMTAGLLLLLYPAQVVRIALRKWRSGASPRFAFGYGLWMMVGKFAQLGGLIRYHGRSGSTEPRRLIEYKGASEGGSMNFSEMCALIAQDYRANGREWTRPGFRALFWHRFGNWRIEVQPKLLRAPLSIIYRWGYRHCRNVYGIELPYTAKVGRGVIIEHQGGIVIHGASVIGDGSIIRQNCTLGLRSLDRLDDAPVIGRRVNIGAGAVIIGKVVIGDDAAIGANAVVMTDVPAAALAVGVPAQIKTRR